MRKTIILGCGNVFAGDDGVGVKVAEKLLEKAFPPEVEIIRCGMAGPFLLDLIIGAKKVIIVDAVLGGEKVGTVLHLTEKDLLYKEGAFRSPHQLDIPEILSLGRVIDPENFPKEIVIIGIQIKEQKRWEIGLSPPVEAAVDVAVAAVEREILGEEGGGKMGVIPPFTLFC